MAERADIEITIGGTAIGYLRQAELSGPVLSLVDVAPEDVYGWEEKRPGTLSWGATASVIVPYRGTSPEAALVLLKQAMVERETVTAAMNLNGETETGAVIVASISMAGSVGGILEGSISLTGTGALTAS